MEQVDQGSGVRAVLRVLVVAAMLVASLAPGFIRPQEAEAAVTGHWAGAECITYYNGTNSIQIIDSVYSTMPGDVWYTAYRISYRPTGWGLDYQISLTSNWIKHTTTNAGWNTRSNGHVQVWPGYDWKVEVFHWNGGTQTRVPVVYYLTRYGSTTGPKSWNHCSV